MYITSKEDELYDLAGVGIGPFNLGLAALASSILELKTIFLDSKKSFEWHPGMLLKYATLQVPFYADLVTLADPCSPYSYLNFLKSCNRLFKFAVREENYVYRLEYNAYCQWVAGQLNSLRFGNPVKAIYYNSEQEHFIIHCNKGRALHARKIVLGIGSKPHWPLEPEKVKHKDVIHSSRYAFHKKRLSKLNSIILIGSGQSAAEIYCDLLQDWHTADKKLAWYTRPAMFFPMDVSPFSCEFSTPDYIRYFYHLPAAKKAMILKTQSYLYKGINHGLLKQIYDLLYLKAVNHEDLLISMQGNCSVQSVQSQPDGNYETGLFHHETETAFNDRAAAIIFATGYHYEIPDFIKPIKHLIAFSSTGTYKTSLHYSIDKKGGNIFIQNAEMETHGFNAPDLSLGPYRNGKILNSITGKEIFKFGERNIFQQFG